MSSKAFDADAGREARRGTEYESWQGGTGLPLARTTSGTLELRTDKKGLLPSASLDLRDPDVQALQVKVERGDVNQMSFAFRTIRQEWNDDEPNADAPRTVPRSWRRFDRHERCEPEDERPDARSSTRSPHPTVRSHCVPHASCRSHGRRKRCPVTRPNCRCCSVSRTKHAKNVTT
jgi:hypothetical protein